MQLFEPKSTSLTVKYYPDGHTLTESPARFTFMPAGDDGLVYTLEICKDEHFKKDVIIRNDILYNFYTLDIKLDVGSYYWRYSTFNKEGKKLYSKVRSFFVVSDYVDAPIKSKQTRYKNVSESHPRLFLNKCQIDNFRDNLKSDSNFCGFDDFYKCSVEPFLNKKFPNEPDFYPDNKKQIDIWRNNYMICQEALCYIRSLCIAGVILKNEQLIEKAKEALLELSNWDVDGSTSRDYNDECAFRVAYGIAFGFDWLYDFLTKEQRSFVLDILYKRTKQVADHVIKDSRVHYFLYDSHAVRSLSSVLTPCSIAMFFEDKNKDQDQDAEKWLDYTIEYFSAIYTPWGGEDGGWAEGPMYWTTGMAFLTEAFNFIKNFTSIDLYKRPFFQKTADFILNCYPHNTYRACFCDQSNIGEKPGIKTAFNLRQFGAISDKPEAVWYFNQVIKRTTLNTNDFFNTGWWDLFYDDMFFKYFYGSAKEQLPSKELKVKWFKDIGWVSINKNIEEESEHIFFLTKSSPYGSVSHSHGDQNSIIIFAYGEPLIIKSGHYIGFGSSMHRDYRRQTLSHNTLLIDGKGQYAGADKIKQLNATGNILEVKQKYVYIKEDATNAYLENVKSLKSYIREIYFVDEQYFIIVDSVDSDEDVNLTFLLHSLTSFNINDKNFYIKGKNADLKGTILYSSAGIKSIEENDIFENVNKDELENLSKQYHYKATTNKSKKHKIVTLLYPLKKDEEKYISFMKDDQGHEIIYYIQNDGKTFSLIVT